MGWGKVVHSRVKVSALSRAREGKDRLDKVWLGKAL